MKKIRKCFESNSSSSHTIVLGKGTPLLTSLTPDKDGFLCANGGEFGWEWEKYNDTQTKFDYMELMISNYQPKFREIFEVAVKEHTGAKGIKKCYNEDDAYIDHQSIGKPEFMEMLLKKRHIIDFIFNSKNYLVTGNDNGSAPIDFHIVDRPNYKFCCSFTINMSPSLEEKVYAKYKGLEVIQQEAQPKIFLLKSLTFKEIKRVLTQYSDYSLLNYEDSSKICQEIKNKNNKSNEYLYIKTVLAHNNSYYFGRGDGGIGVMPIQIATEETYNQILISLKKEKKVDLGWKVVVEHFSSSKNMKNKCQELFEIPMMMTVTENPEYNSNYV